MEKNEKLLVTVVELQEGISLRLCMIESRLRELKQSPFEQKIRCGNVRFVGGGIITRRILLKFKAGNEACNRNCQCGWRVGRSPDAPGEGEKATGNGSVAGVHGVGTTGDGSSDCRVGGRSSWQLVTTLVATVGNVDICLDCSCRYFHESADSLRYFPLLGFTGNRNRRIRGGKERGENHAGFHAQAALIQ